MCWCCCCFCNYVEVSYSNSSTFDWISEVRSNMTWVSNALADFVNCFCFCFSFGGDVRQICWHISYSAPSPPLSMSLSLSLSCIHARTLTHPHRHALAPNNINKSPSSDPLLSREVIGLFKNLGRQIEIKNLTKMKTHFLKK